MSDTVTAWTLRCVRADASMVSCRHQIQPFLKVPAIQDDDFLPSIPYTAPPRWRKSETEVMEIQRVDRIGGCDWEVVWVRVWGARERTGRHTRWEGWGFFWSSQSGVGMKPDDSTQLQRMCHKSTGTSYDEVHSRGSNWATKTRHFEGISKQNLGTYTVRYMLWGNGINFCFTKFSPK